MQVTLKTDSTLFGYEVSLLMRLRNGKSITKAGTVNPSLGEVYFELGNDQEFDDFSRSIIEAEVLFINNQSGMVHTAPINQICTLLQISTFRR